MKQECITAAEYRQRVLGEKPAPARKEERPRQAPRRKVGRVSEHEEQKGYLAICEAHYSKYPELQLLRAIPNGGHRSKATAAKMKAEGQKAGVLDLDLPVARGGYQGFKLEMKAVGGVISEAQYRELLACSAQGYRCVVAWGAEEAWRLTEEYLQL